MNFTLNNMYRIRSFSVHSKHYCYTSLGVDKQEFTPLVSKLSTFIMMIHNMFRNTFFPANSFYVTL